MGAARRQVLIEATVVEVQLSDNYQSGVDWSALGLNGLGYSFTQSLISGTSTLANTALPFFSVQYINPNAAAGGSISSTVKLLDTFGNTRVLSSPRIMVLNNQTAMLKVVDNLRVLHRRGDPDTLSSNQRRRRARHLHDHPERGAGGLHHERDPADQRRRRGRAQRAPDGDRASSTS